MLGMIFASAIRDAQAQVDAAKRDMAMIIEEPEVPRFDKFSAEQRPEMPDGFSGNLDTRTVREHIDARQPAKPLQPQVGDEVLIKVQINGKIDSARLQASNAIGMFEIYHTDILSIEPRKPCVGDVVTWGARVCDHRIAAISDKEMVVEGAFAPGTFKVISLPVKDLHIVSRASQEKKS